MATAARGLICLTLTGEHCERMKLPMMSPSNTSPFGTNFTVSIEAARGVTTGISAEDRARTILTAVAPEARPEDIVTPGHVFPLRAAPGGVLARAGTHRGRLRFSAAGGIVSGGGDLRNYERGRNNGAAGRFAPLRRAPQFNGGGD